jgi:hypothetical protein
LAGRKQAAQTYDVEGFNLRTLNELEISKQYDIKISNRFKALGNLNVSKNINKAWEDIEESTKTSTKESLGLYELKQNEASFDKDIQDF